MSIYSMFRGEDMNRTMVRIVAVLLCVTFLMGCVTNTHTIGNGPDSGFVETKRQYYVLGGLFPLGTTDSRTMAGNDPNYRIETEFTLMDFIISGLTGGIVMSRTIRVIK